MLDDGLLQIDEVGRLQRVRLVVRERSVELEVHRDDLDRQGSETGCIAEHGRYGHPAHAVSGVHDNTNRADATEIDEPAKVRRVVGENIDLTKAAGLSDLDETVFEVLRRSVADRGETGVHADPLRTGPAELDAVVGCRVVARGEHGGRRIERSGGEVGLVGRAEPDGDDVGTAGARAGGKGRGELRRGIAHVMADNNVGTTRADLISESGGESGDDLARQLASDEPPNVVGLDERGEVG